MQGLLEDAKAFKLHFEGPITASTDRRAGQAAVALGAERGRQLRALIAPCFLRREKAQIQQAPGRCAQDALQSQGV